MAEQSWKDFFTAPPNVPRPMSDDPASPYFTLPEGVKLVPVEHNPYDLEAAKANLPQGPLTMGPGEDPFWKRLLKGQVGPGLTDIVGSVAGTALGIPQYTKDVLTGQLDPASPEGIRKAADIGMLLGAGGATRFATAKGAADPNTLGLFYGQKAKVQPGNGSFLRYQMDEATGKLAPPEQLHQEYYDWLKAQGLPKVSWNNLYPGNLTDIQQKWLQNWGERLDHAAWEEARPSYTPGQVFRGADNKLRFESPDTGSYIDLNKVVPSTTQKLGELFSHPTLFDAYPELANMKVKFEPMQPGTMGYFDDSANTLGLSNNLVHGSKWEDLHSVLLHEIQHKIQEREGFANGANPTHPAVYNAVAKSPEQAAFNNATLAIERFKTEVQKKAGNRDFYGYLADNPQLQELFSDLSKRVTDTGEALDKLPFKLYESVAGEIESRNVQHRWNNNSYENHPLKGDPTAPTAEYPNPLAIDEKTWQLIPAKDYKP